MKLVETNGAQVYWQEFGRGDPVVMIMGLGCSSAMWFRLAPAIARHYRVILLDNRGAGRTRVDNFVTHRITSMADDVAAVMDAAGERSAHIVGFSMGGMVAQQLAMAHNRRVRTLTLLGTNCGGPNAVLAQRNVTDLLFAKGRMTAEESLRAIQPFVYARSTPQQLIDEDTAVRIATAPSLRDFQAQLSGLMAWTSFWSLPNLRVPTLVIHGLEDQLIPPQNGSLIASRIPGARLVELPNASHWLFTDQTNAVAGHILKFLSGASQSSSVERASMTS
jgi:3-oxoadipate enol-lactonase